jgi:glycosyltransferase involved in cell wall biosynthesis
MNIPTILEYQEKRLFKDRISAEQAFDSRNLSDYKPLVSIITVVRNCEKTIEQTIISVISQDYDNIEYIIIDGDSSDETVKVIQKHNDSISYWVSEPDHGISDAFNKGISLSNGEIIGIINGDDWYEKNIVGKVVKKFVENPTIDIVHGKMCRWASCNTYEIVDSDDSYLTVDSTVNHPTVFVKRTVYSNIGLFRLDFKIAMDYEWLLRGKAKGINFTYIDECLSNMRIDGISGERWIIANLEVLKAKNLYFNVFFNFSFFCFQVIKGSLRKIFERFGFHYFIRHYHLKHSLTIKRGNYK